MSSWTSEWVDRYSGLSVGRRVSMAAAPSEAQVLIAAARARTKPILALAATVSPSRRQSFDDPHYGFAVSDRDDLRDQALGCLDYWTREVTLFDALSALNRANIDPWSRTAKAVLLAALAAVAPESLSDAARSAMRTNFAELVG